MVILPSLQQLRFLCALAEQCHFGRAAESCAVTQSTLSGGIKELDTRLGVTLFERSHRHVMLTPLGERDRDARPAPAGRRRGTAVRIWAQQSPFELKVILKRRAYRWNDGTDGRPKSWYLDVEEETLDAELRFLENEIYQREVEVHRQEITSLDHYSRVSDPRAHIKSGEALRVSMQRYGSSPSLLNSIGRSWSSLRRIGGIVPGRIRP